MDATGPTIRGNHWGAGDAGFIKYRNGLDLGRGGSTYLKVDSSTPVVVVGRGTNTAGVVGVGFDGTNSALSSPDAFIIRDGAGILSLRNPITNNSPQQLRIFNISGTNTGEFGLVGWINSGLVIGPQQTTSGTLRNLTLTGSNINLSATGNILIDRNSQIIFPSRFGTTSIPNRLYTDSPTDTNNNYYFYGGNGGGNFVFNNQDGNWNLVLATAGAIGFTQPSSAQKGSFSPDVLLYRDAANTLALRNGTTSQQFRAYNTTGTNSGEFGLFGWQNNNLIIGSQATNSGILRNITITGNNININASGVLNIFDNTNIVGNLTVSGNTTITGHLSAASKSFLIDHPTIIGKKLQYGSLESPYHGIRLTDKNKISADSVKVNLPDYISALVNEDKVNVQLTNINHDKVLFVKEVNVNDNNFIVGINRGWFDKNEYEFYWSFTAERKDIPKLTVEF
jgi:hypothetical protein